MRSCRASKRPPEKISTSIINNLLQPQQQPVQQSQAVKPRKQKQNAPQQLQRVPQQVVNDYEPLHKSPNATPLSDNSITTYLSQFRKAASRPPYGPAATLDAVDRARRQSMGPTGLST